MARPIDVLLLLALPASGKSEVRRYLSWLPDAQRRADFGIGTNVQLDDYPYVHMMRRASQELARRGEDPAFFETDVLPMKDGRDWGTLIMLLNEDYADVVARRRQVPASASELLFARLDAARCAVGARPVFEALAASVRTSLASTLERESAALLADKNAEIADSLEGRTVVIECARGGPDGHAMPLPSPYGYAHSLRLLAPAILERAHILYVWVTPEESRRKNEARADPDDPGSILHHGVPKAVMFGDYGCDDMDWMLRESDRPGTVCVAAHGRTFHLPVARFDNRVDRTSFLRADPGMWARADVSALHAGLVSAFG